MHPLGHNDYGLTDTIPITKLSGSFNAREAYVHISGLFGGYIRGKAGLTMVAKAELSFQGSINTERSDELFLGRGYWSGVQRWGMPLIVQGDEDSARLVSGS
jgi:hypothetical protein